MGPGASQGREMSAAPRICLGSRLFCRAQAEQSLKSGHRLPPPVVTKDELVQVHLELLLAHSVVGSDEPLLEIGDRSVSGRLVQKNVLTWKGEELVRLECGEGTAERPLPRPPGRDRSPSPRS